MLFREWHDYVTCPLDPQRIQTAAERLNLQGAQEAKTAQDPKAPIRVARDSYLSEGDDFVAMDVSDRGDVTVWTRRQVLRLWRAFGSHRLIDHEKHLGSFRSAADALALWPGRDGPVLVLTEWRDFIVKAESDGMPVAPAQRLDEAALDSTGVRRIGRSEILSSTESMETAYLGRYGEFFLWTTNFVWSIWHAGGCELLLRYPRNPPRERLF